MTRKIMENSIWIWLAGCMMSIVILIGAGILWDTRKLIYDQQCSISTLQQTKADRIEMREFLGRIETKVDQIYNMHLEKSLRGNGR